MDDKRRKRTNEKETENSIKTESKEKGVNDQRKRVIN